MGKIKKILATFVILISIFTFSCIKADAATGTVTMTSNKSKVVVGNSVTFTVTISSSKPIGVFQYSLSYDSSMLNLTSGDKAIEAESIELNETYIKFELGEKKQLSYNIEPKNVSSNVVKWYSSNEAVATVENGVIVTKGVGSAVVTVATLNGKTDICNIEVTSNNIEDVPVKIIEVESIKFSQNEITLNKPIDEIIVEDFNNILPGKNMEFTEKFKGPFGKIITPILLITL